jgi:hypothetical protein
VRSAGLNLDAVVRAALALADADDQQFREGLQRMVPGYLAVVAQPG